MQGVPVVEKRLSSVFMFASRGSMTPEYRRVIENNSIIHTRANNNDIANVKRDVRAFSRTNDRTILGVAFNAFSRFALNEI